MELESQGGWGDSVERAGKQRVKRIREKKMVARELWQKDAILADGFNVSRVDLQRKGGRDRRLNLEINGSLSCFCDRGNGEVLTQQKSPCSGDERFTKEGF